MSGSFFCDRCKRTLTRDGQPTYHDPENIYGVPKELHEDMACYCDDCYEEFKAWWLNRYGKEFPHGMPEVEVEKLKKGEL